MLWRARTYTQPAVRPRLPQLAPLSTSYEYQLWFLSPNDGASLPEGTNQDGQNGWQVGMVQPRGKISQSASIITNNRGCAMKTVRFIFSTPCETSGLKWDWIGFKNKNKSNFLGLWIRWLLFSILLMNVCGVHMFCWHLCREGNGKKSTRRGARLASVSIPGNLDGQDEKWCLIV